MKILAQILYVTLCLSIPTIVIGAHFKIHSLWVGGWWMMIIPGCVFTWALCDGIGKQIDGICKNTRGIKVWFDKDD